MDKLEFGSAPWCDALEGAIRDVVAGLPEAERKAARFSMCEVYTGVPARLAPAGELAWHCRIAGGEVDFVHAPADDVDVKIVVDYAGILPLARLSYAGMTDEQSAGMTRTLGALVRDGKLLTAGTTEPPAFMRSVHDRLAPRTA